jgi:shikimate dehydrogenase
MKNLCVIGWPIAHSRSPLIHNYWIKLHGLDAHYDKRPIEPAAIAHFLEDFVKLGLSGCNITVPHKETVFALLKNVDATSQRLGTVNTLYLRNESLHGTNTDGIGFYDHLMQSHADFMAADRNIVVIGAGGAAKAIIGTLLDHDAGKISVTNRSSGRVDGLQVQFGPKIFSLTEANLESAFAECDLLINTTSLGMQGQPRLQLDLSSLGKQAIVADIVYAPLETELLQQARARGNPTLGGLGMLLHQAVHGFELWFDIKPDVTQELFNLVAADLLKVPA